MAAHRLWLELLLELIVYGSAVSLLHGSVALHWIAWVALLIAFMFLTRVVIVVATFIFAMRVQPDAPPLSAAAWFRLILLESVGLARVQWLIMIDSLGLRPKQSPTRSERDIPLIILLHGIYCAGAIWNPIARALSKKLSCEIVAPSLTPTSSGLSAQAQCFGNWLEQHLAGRTQRRIIVIAHSMGGLVMRQYLAHAPSPVRIDTLICVSTPFRGSRIAEFLRTPIGRDLRPNSPAIQQLQTTHWPTSTRLTVIASAHDNLVIPADSAHLPNASHTDINQFGHLSLLYSRELLDALLKLLHAHP